MARNKKVEILSHSGEVLHPITDGDCVIFPDGETLTHKLSEDEAVMYTPEVTNSSPMFKVGEGDSSDYSANVLDGAYQEAVLKGQTYVNTIQEPSADVITLPTPFTEYERTQSKTFTEMQDGTFGLNLVGQSYVNCIQEPSEPSYVALGENLEFQNKKVEYTSDGQIKSAMLNGMTLVNLWDNIGQHSIAPNNFVRQVGNCFKKSTKYLLKYNVLQTNTNNSMIVQYYQNGTWIVNEPSYTKLNEDYYILTTPSADFNDIRIFYANDFGTETVILKDIMLIEYQEGMENWDIPYFQGMQSVTMSTELENVCSRYNSSGAKNGKTFTVGSAATRSLKLSTAENISSYNFKQNTKYLLQFKITNLNLDGLENVKLYFSESNISEGNALFGDLANAMVRITKNGIYRVVLTTSSIVDTSGFVIKGLGTEWENTTSTTRKLTISQIMCIEYQNGMENWDLPYFETKQLMKPLKVQSVNKNLFDTANMFSSYKTTISEVTTNSFRLTGTDSNGTYKNTQFLFDVKPNTDYKITFKSEATDGDSLCDVYDANAKYLGNRNFNSGNNTRVSVRFYVNMNNTKNGTVKYYDVQMEESSTETPYTPHQEKTTSALEPITLRAIGSIKDTLDLSTGEYVQRIGEIVLDGSDDEDWKMATNSDNANAYRFDTKIISGKIPLVGNGTLPNIVCDKYTTITFNHAYSGNAQGIAIFQNSHIVINNGMTALADFKASLASNPIKVQYELANPITRKISLEYPNLRTYTDITHVQSIAMDGTLIPKIFLPSDISYRAMLKPNTSYNVIVDREVIDSTNQLTVNLGGTTANITANRTVVRTPSTLSNETLTFSGKDNRIAKAMLVEGSTLINGDLPHFDGIGDVKLGRVVENLCMSNEMVAGGATVTSTLYTDRIELKITKEGSCVETFELTKQLQNGKKYFVYCPWNCSNNSYVFGAGFRMSYNGSISFAQQVKGVDNKKYIIFTIDEKEQLNPYTHFTIGFHGGMAVNTTMTIRRPILCEYIDGMENWDWESIGYFTGTRNIGNEFMRIGNKNLFDGINRRYYINVETYLMGLTNNDSGGVVDVSNVDNVVVSSTSTQTRFRIGCTNKLPSENGETVTVYNGVNLDGNSSAKASIDCSNYKYLIINAVDLSIVQVEEATSATSYVTHKHNALHILPNEQIPLTFVQGVIIYGQNSTWESAINNTNTNRIRTQLLDLEPNETYRISCGSTNHSFTILGYDNNLLGKFDSGWTYDEYYFTTTKDVHKYAINVRYKDNSNITPSALHQVRLEKVTDVTLRSVGDVKDELDLTRGVYIQRVEEVVLDGINNNKIQPYSIGGDNKHFIQVRLKNKKDGGFNAICYNEKLMKDDDGYLNIANSNPPSNKLMVTGDKNIRFTFSGGNNLDLNTELEMLKQYPITVQYVLETPIEHKINIPMKNELNQTIAKPNGIFTLPLMYDGNNHVDINSQIYPKVQSKDYISYPVIANNSQLHTVFHNKLGTGNLTVTLCGTSVTSVDGTSKCTITTPSTISQYELRLSGAGNKVSNVCVFSGDYMNVNVPYVQGMMNAVNPTVKNASLNHANITTSGHTNFYIGRIYKGETYSLKLNRNKNVGYNLVLKYGTAVDGGEEILKDFIFSDFTTFTSNYNGYLYFNGWETVDVDNIMLCLGTYTEQNMPQYEPYKENICEPHSDEIITLRSLPNGVRDELNLQTGEYIQRIGDVVFDGSSDEVMWFNSGWMNGDYVACYWNVNAMGLPNKKQGLLNMICSTFPTVTSSIVQNGGIVTREGIWGETGSSVMYISIKKTKLPELNTNGFRQWASQNPITVQYELETPIIKQIDINNFPHSYKDGHVIIESNDPSTNVTAQMTYRCITNRSGQIQEHTEQVEKQERQINELETLILENIRQQQNRSQNFLTSLISTLEIEEE